LLVIDRRDFLPFVQERPLVALRIIDLLCARLRQTSEQVEDVAFRLSAGRLAKAILRLQQERLETAQDGRLAITQRELGQIVGMSRESTNKQLMSFQREKLLEVVKGGIVILDAEGLAERAGSMHD
jgi:CRP-like cAMP-binding protein